VYLTFGTGERKTRKEKGTNAFSKPMWGIVTKTKGYVELEFLIRGKKGGKLTKD